MCMEKVIFKIYVEEYEGIDSFNQNRLIKIKARQATSTEVDLKHEGCEVWCYKKEVVEILATGMVEIHLRI